MGLEIAGEEARRLAEQLAERRGTNIEEAVEAALRAELAREQDALPPEMAKWIGIAKDGWPEGMTSINATDFLYDGEIGLPR